MRWSTLSVMIAGAACLGCEPPSLSQQQRAVEEQFLANRVSEWSTALNNSTLDTVPEETGARDTLLALYEDSPDVHAVWPDGRYAIGFEAVEQSIADSYNLWDFKII